MAEPNTDYYVSSQASMAIELTPEEFADLKSAAEMLASMPNMRDIPSDWKVQSGNFEADRKGIDYKKKLKALRILSNQVNTDEPDIKKIYQAVKQILEYGTLKMKTTESKKAIREGLADLADKCEKDHEVQMARSELYKLSKYAIKLHDLLKTVSEREGLQAWQQGYITKAADYIDAVYHDLEYEQELGREVDVAIDDAEAIEEGLADDVIATAKKAGLPAKKRKSPEEMKRDRDEMVKKREKNRRGRKAPGPSITKSTTGDPAAYYASKKPGEYTGDSVDYSSQLASRLAENVKKRLK